MEQRKEASIRVKMTAAQKALFKKAAVRDHLDEVSVWAHALMDRRARYTAQPDFAPLGDILADLATSTADEPRKPWPCPNCKRINSPYNSHCDCIQLGGVAQPTP